MAWNFGVENNLITARISRVGLGLFVSLRSALCPAIEIPFVINRGQRCCSQPRGCTMGMLDGTAPLSNIVRDFKRITARRTGVRWQRNYFDHRVQEG